MQRIIETFNHVDIYDVGCSRELPPKKDPRGQEARDAGHTCESSFSFNRRSRVRHLVISREWQRQITARRVKLSNLRERRRMFLFCSKLYPVPPWIYYIFRYLTLAGHCQMTTQSDTSCVLVFCSNCCNIFHSIPSTFKYNQLQANDKFVISHDQ